VNTEALVHALDAAYTDGLIGPWTSETTPDDRGRRRRTFTILLATGDVAHFTPAQAWAFVTGVREARARLVRASRVS